MKIYDVEIPGSSTFKKKVALAGLKKIAKSALGIISVAWKGTEIFFGNGDDLLFEIELAEERGRSF